MRRLPIYFLIDVSESMIGEPIQHVQAGMEAIIKELRTDPYALETVHLSIIAFAGRAQKLSNMEELYNFYPPKLPIGGGTSLGNAMNFLMNDMDSTIIKTTAESKGDWKPIVFLFTDGAPTDNVDIAFKRWNEKYRRSSNLIAISIGENMDTSVLSQISDNVLQLKDTDEVSFKSFFKWITASIKTTSMSVNDLNSDDLKLAPFSDDILTKIEKEMSQPIKVDENFAVILGKCQNTLQPYLLKYQKRLDKNDFSHYTGMGARTFKFVGAYPIDNSYFEMVDGYGHGGLSGNKVNTNELVGFPSCPCCANHVAIGLCMCGNIMCVGHEQTSKCPWCGVQVSFRGSDGGMDIGRTQG
jgi:uncharacterized protein YegL